MLETNQQVKEQLFQAHPAQEPACTKRRAAYLVAIDELLADGQLPAAQLHLERALQV